MAIYVQQNKQLQNKCDKLEISSEHQSNSIQKECRNLKLKLESFTEVNNTLRYNYTQQHKKCAEMDKKSQQLESVSKCLSFLLFILSTG